jgi:hypothetical protein
LSCLRTTGAQKSVSHLRKPHRNLRAFYGIGAQMPTSCGIYLDAQKYSE